MKLFKTALCAILAAAMLIPMCVFANDAPIQQNPPVATPKAEPTLDGVIDAADGWSDPAKLNDDSVKYLMDYRLPCATDANIYFAYDEGGLYYAADITELAEFNGEPTDNTFMYSTGEDLFDRESGENIVGYNGDVFVLALDPLGLYIQNGFISATDYSVWYCVSLFEGDVARMYRSRANSGDITDQVEISGKATDYGWTFEAYLPWELIIADMEEYTYGRATCTVEDLIQGGAQFRSAAIYMDRFDDPEMGELYARGAYMTACAVTHEGNPAKKINGHCNSLYGLNFYIEYNEPAFADVKEDHWYYDAVKYCYNREYMSGTSADKFSPNSFVTREMFVKVLANLAEADLSDYTTSSFKDIPTGQWYSAAVEWAYQNGLTSGVSDDTFGRGQSVTREQLATFMTRFAEYTCKNTTGRADLTVFKDAAKISDWAKDGMSWMVYKGFVSGVGENTLDPKGTATRAQMAVLINNYMSEYGLVVFS